MAGVKHVPIAGLARVGLIRTGWAKVVKAGERATPEEKKRAMNALRDAGRSDLVYETFNTQTVSKWLREIDQDPEQSMPPELEGAVTFDVDYVLSVTDTRPKRPA